MSQSISDINIMRKMWDELLDKGVSFEVLDTARDIKGLTQETLRAVLWSRRGELLFDFEKKKLTKEEQETLIEEYMKIY